MIDVADIFRWLVDAGAACMALLVLAYGVMLVLKEPARRLRVGELALAGCLVLAVIQAVPATRVSIGVVEPGTPVRLPWYDDSGAGSAGAEGKVIAAKNSGAPAVKSGTVGAIAERRGVADVLLYWREMLVGVYLVGVMLMGMRMAGACWALRRLLRRAGEASEDVAGLWERLTRGSGRAIRLGISGDVDRPLTFGLWRPVVLLPASMAGASVGDLRAVLRHELGHIERHDAGAWMLAAVADTLLFFVPPLWLIKRQMRLAQEFLADAVAAESTGGAVAYAEMMLRLVKMTQGQGAPRLAGAGLLTVGAWVRPSDLMLRIRHLFASRGELLRGVTRRWTLCAAVCVMVVTSVLGAVTLADTSLNSKVRAHELEGVAFLLRSQRADGGWLTNIGPAPTALIVRSLLQAGVPADHPAIVRARHYIDGCLQSDGGYYTDGEPTYHTAVVLSMYAAFGDADAAARLKAGRVFLERELARQASNGGGASDWYQSSVKESLASGVNFADPRERAADAILDTYGSLTYTKWKSMVYAGLSESDPRVKQATRWLTQNWTLDKHPGTGSAEGLYYYYLAAAKTLRASNLQTFADGSHHTHAWREEMQVRLLGAQAKDGSWVNTGSGRWLEDRPEMVTAYALLALQETRK